jgi:eukaryotic-like serine/threonine-protein kinase
LNQIAVASPFTLKSRPSTSSSVRVRRSRESERALEERLRSDSALGVAPYAITRALARLDHALDSGLPVDRQLSAVESELDRAALDSIPVPIDRPYLQAADLLARAGKPDKAKTLVARFRTEVADTSFQRWQEPAVHTALGSIAEAEGRWAEAARELREGDRRADGPVNVCDTCLPLRLFDLFARAGMADSALAQYDAYRQTPRVHTRTRVRTSS